MSYPFTFKNWFLDGVQLVKETIDDTIDYIHDKVAVSEKEIRILRKELWEYYYSREYRRYVLQANPKLEHEYRYESCYDGITDTEEIALCQMIQEDPNYTDPKSVHLAVHELCHVYANRKLEKIDVRKKRLKERSEARHFKYYMKRIGEGEYGY